MKLKVVTKTLAASAVALLIAGCGGGGGEPAASSSLDLSGTAAVGAALASADVQVKCAQGSGTATTTTVGGYTVSISGGALPCIIKVSGTHNGVAVSLHSVAQAGSSDANGNTRAVANVTPVTEMIVAQLTAGLPADVFANFNPSQVTQETLASAATAIVDALKAAGVDLTGINPITDTLVPATSTGTGNAYDQLLDLLGDTVPAESLPLVVNQIANAATTQSTTGLTEAMAAVSGGSLAGCPQAISGKYRTLDYFGRTVVREIDFKNNTFMSGNGTDAFTITPIEDKPCEFIASGTVGGTTSEFSVAIGTNGVGTYKARNTAPTATTGVIGYIFPVQSHAASAFAGTWTFLQSGFDPTDGLIHWPGQLTLNGDNTVHVCDYDTTTWTCMQEDDEGMTASARSDGGMDLNEPGANGVANLYGYRAPNGSFAVFGTTNAAGVNSGTVQQTSIVATKLNALTLPAVGTEVKYWDASITQFGSSRTVMAPAADANTVIAVDAAANSATRKRASDGREDTVRYNTPLEGVRTRDAGSWNGSNFAAVYQIPLTGLGVTVSVNKNPSSTTSPHIYNLSVLRP